VAISDAPFTSRASRQLLEGRRGGFKTLLDPASGMASRPRKRSWTLGIMQKGGVLRLKGGRSIPRTSKPGSERLQRGIRPIDRPDRRVRGQSAGRPRRELLEFLLCSIYD